MHKLSVVHTVEKLHANTLSLTQVMASLNEKIDSLDPKLNAFLHRCEPESIVSNDNSPLAGLPVSFKDQYHIAGLPCSFGMPKATLSSSTADLVILLRDKGANILGKTSLPPLAMDFQTSNDMRGFCNNPWNTLYTCGGSSGGGAAAVASGMSFLDFGTDLAGSLRIPASYCGVFSLLPSEGAFSHKGILVNNDKTLAHFARIGPIANSIDDLTFIWHVLTDSPRKTLPYHALNIAFWQTAETLPVDNDIINAMNHVLSQWQSDGHNCQMKKPSGMSFDVCWQAFGHIMGHDIAALMNPLVRWLSILTSKKSIKHSPHFIKNVISGYHRNKKRYQKHIKQRQKIIASTHAFFEDIDVWVLPVTCNIAFKHITPNREHGPNRDYFDPITINSTNLNYYDALTAFTSVTGLIGHPVITMPIGLDRNGIPIGVQLVGKMNGEQALLHAACQLYQNIHFPNCPAC